MVEPWSTRRNIPVRSVGIKSEEFLTKSNEPCLRFVAATCCGRGVAFTSTSTRLENHQTVSNLFLLLQVHNRMTMEEYGRLMVNYKDTPAEQQQKQTRQMSYVESNIDWWV